MKCPNCGKDYKDVPPGKVPGHYYRGDPHFGMSFRRIGLLCNNCGFCAEVIIKPTGAPYRKRDVNKDLNQIQMFDDEKRKAI